MNKKKLYIVGAGSVGGHIAYNLEEYTSDYKLEGFFDDDEGKIGTQIYGYPVLGPISDLLKLSEPHLVVGIAFPKTKKKIVEKLSENSDISFPSLVHSKAWVSRGVKIGIGSVIYPGTSVNYGSKIGDHIVINMNCALGHHTEIYNYTSLAPGVNTGGHTMIGTCVEMGIGSSTIQDISIGDRSIVGGQAMVVRNVSADERVIGIPAK